MPAPISLLSSARPGVLPAKPGTGARLVKLDREFPSRNSAESRSYRYNTPGAIFLDRQRRHPRLLTITRANSPGP